MSRRATAGSRSIPIKGSSTPSSSPSRSSSRSGASARRCCGFVRSRCRCPPWIAIHGGQRHLLLTKPQQRLADAPDLDELREGELDGVLDPLIGMLLDPAVARLDISHGETEDQGPAPRLREQALVGALPNPSQLRLADRALQA